MHCFVCAESWDVIAIEQLRSGADFRTACQTVARAVGVDLATDLAPAPSVHDKPKKERQTATVVPLPMDQARQIFTADKLLTKYARETWGDRINGMWAARNERGEVEVVDVRFEKDIPAKSGPDGNTVPAATSKNVITHYWDGQSVRSKNAPVVLFGRDLLAARPSDPVCFHEGAKCWAAAQTVPGIVAVTWNRGVENVGAVDLHPLKGRTVFIYPDDDHQIGKPGSKWPGIELPWNEQPGFKTALKLRERLQGIAASVKICAPMVRGPGYDVVDALAQGKTPDEIRAWILEGPALEEPVKEASDGKKKIELGDNPKAQKRNDADQRPRSGGAGGDEHAPRPESPDGTPFRVLGIDEGHAYFLDAAEHLTRFKLTSISKGQLMTLAPLPWWATEFPGGRGSTAWDEATDYVIRESEHHEFDPDRARGRGAWRERDGRVCYHDGHVTLGDPDDGRLYIRKRQIDIGLHDSPATPGERRELLEAVSKMSFETTADCFRMMAWAVLAPFGGACEWRSSVILTGDSGSGKSTLLHHVVVPLVRTPHYWSGIDSTAAGARQKTGNDSYPVIIDEAKGKSEAAKKRREDFLALMQQSTSDDSPSVVKGTPTQEGALTYTMRSMFLFSAVEEDTGSTEQENRLVVVNLKKPQQSTPEDWRSISRRVQNAVTEMVCRGVRAFTWENLPLIIKAAHAMTDAVAEHVGDSRRAFAEALLFAAFWVVYLDRLPDKTELAEWLKTIYTIKPQEEKRNEADEMVQTILDEVVPLQGDTRLRFPLRHILQSIQTGKVRDETEAITGWRDLAGAEKGRYIQTAKNNFVYLVGGEVAIKSKSEKIARAFGQHYGRTLRRHPNAVAGRASVNGLGDVVVIRDLLADEESPF